MKINGLEPEENRRLWQARLSDLAESGMTQKQWCEQHSINISALRYWIRQTNKIKHRQERRSGEWLTVTTNTLAEPDPGTGGSNGDITVSYGAYRVEINESANPEGIYNVLRILKEL